MLKRRDKEVSKGVIYNIRNSYKYILSFSVVRCTEVEFSIRLDRCEEGAQYGMPNQFGINPTIEASKLKLYTISIMKKCGPAGPMTGSSAGHDPYVAPRTISTKHFSLSQIF